MLSMARAKCPHIQSLMMDAATLAAFQERMVDEPASIRSTPEHLTPDELVLFHQLRAKAYGKTRLEQERLSRDYVLQEIHKVLSL